MKTKLFCLLVCLSLAFVNVAGAQEAPQASDMHKVLKQDVGTWNAAMKIYMPGQDAPLEMEGVETNRMLGDMWLVSEFKGDFGGQAFEGHGQFGYDAEKERFVGTWIDSMESSMTTMYGHWDYDSQTLTMMGKGFNSQTGQPTEMKNVSVYKDKDTRLMTMYMKMGDEFVKSMEITYTRK